MTIKPEELSVEEQADLGVFRDEWLPHELGLLIAYKAHPHLYPDEQKRKGIQYRYCSEIETAIEAGKLPAHERECELLSWSDGSSGVSAPVRTVKWQDFVSWYPEAASWGKVRRLLSVDEQRAAAAREAFGAGLIIGPHLTLVEIYAQLKGKYPELFTFEYFHRWWRKYRPFSLRRGRPKGRTPSR